MDHHPNKKANIKPVSFQSFEDGAVLGNTQNLELLNDVSLEVVVELGRTHRKIKDILTMGKGSVIELDKMAGEAVEILVNGKLVAKGEVVVIEDNFAVRITELIQRPKIPINVR